MDGEYVNPKTDAFSINYGKVLFKVSERFLSIVSSVVHDGWLIFGGFSAFLLSRQPLNGSSILWYLPKADRLPSISPRLLVTFCLLVYFFLDLYALILMDLYSRFPNKLNIRIFLTPWTSSPKCSSYTGRMRRCELGSWSSSRSCSFGCSQQSCLDWRCHSSVDRQWRTWWRRRSSYCQPICSEWDPCRSSRLRGCSSSCVGGCCQRKRWSHPSFAGPTGWNCMGSRFCRRIVRLRPCLVVSLTWRRSWLRVWPSPRWSSPSLRIPCGHRSCMLLIHSSRRRCPRRKQCPSAWLRPCQEYRRRVASHCSRQGLPRHSPVSSPLAALAHSLCCHFFSDSYEPTW